MPSGPNADRDVLARMPQIQAKADLSISIGVLRTKRLVTACTTALWDFHDVESQAPGYFKSWLQYHLDILGIDHINIYDVDGSFESVVSPWVAAGRVSYIPRVNELLSPGI